MSLRFGAQAVAAPSLRNSLHSQMIRRFQRRRQFWVSFVKEQPVPVGGLAVAVLVTSSCGADEFYLLC